MITAEDASLHKPDPDQPMWAETNFFGFHSPEEELNGHIYVLLRPNQGVCLTTVALNSKKALAYWDAEYYDSSVHVPMGANFDLQNYSLSSGVSVRCLEPTMKYEVNYDDGNGVEVHFQYDALHPGYDIHDPEMDPMVAAAAEGSDYAWGTAYNGHYDQTGVCEGEILLRGRTIPFRCVATRDHSWGPRPERHPTTLSWLNAAFTSGAGIAEGDVDLAVHAMCDFDDSSGAADIRFTHGYAVEKGEWIGLAGGRAKTRRSKYQPEQIELELSDGKGREWSLRGECLTAFPWPAWPNVVGFNSLVRWDWDGRQGLGEAYDFYGLQQLNQLSESPHYR